MTVDELKKAILSESSIYAYKESLEEKKNYQKSSILFRIDLIFGTVDKDSREIADLSRNGRSNFDWLVWLSAEHDFIFNSLGSLAPYIDQIKQIKNPKPKNESIDVKDLLAQFDLDAIGKSAIKYYQAIIDLSEKIFDHLQKLENISPDNESMQKLKLTPEDIRGQIKDMQNQIESLKSQADQFFIQLDEVNNSPNSIQKLAELESMPRPSFEFIIENFANIINKLSIHNLK